MPGKTFALYASSFFAANHLQVQKDRKWNFVEVNVLSDALQEWKLHVAEVMLPQNTLMDITISAALWFAAR